MATGRDEPETRSLVWPLPVPYDWDLADPPPRSRRQQRRRAWSLARRRLTNLVVVALNHARCNFARWVPAGVAVRRPLSVLQWDHVHRLERLVARWGRTHVQDLGCGRKGDALEKMISQLETQVQLAGVGAHDYGASFRVRGPAPGFVLVNPDRLSFPEKEYHFHAADFLGPYL